MSGSMDCESTGLGLTCHREPPILDHSYRFQLKSNRPFDTIMSKRKVNVGSSSSSDEGISPPPPPKKFVPVKIGPWHQALRASMDDPKFKMFEDERLVVIKDKYPKARHHFLVMPKEKIDSLTQLTKAHIELLEKMKEAGSDVAAENGSLDHFRIGFHAKPSMMQLHLHVISQDFLSPCLKTKQHWNSFTTPFFRSVDDVIKELNETGGVAPSDAVLCNEWIKGPLRCHRCKNEKILPTIPKLKEHLLMHDNQNPLK